MTTGQKKDLMLRAIEFNGKPFTQLYRKLVDKNDDDGKIDLLMNEMMNDGLIKYEDKNNVPRDWNFVILDIKGQKIKDAGGWLTVKYQSMDKDEKIYRLLKYAIETDASRFGWTVNELMPAFEDALNEYEIQHLCEQLIENNDAKNLTTKDGFEIGIIEKSRSAFYGEKYSKSKQSVQIQPTSQSITIGTIQQIIESTVHGGLTQTSDSSSNKLTSEPKQVNKSPINIKKIIKYIFWVLGVILTVYGIYEMLIKLKMIG
jgi:hypothetical protein